MAAAARKTTVSADLEKAAVNRAEKLSASASVPEGGSLARTIGDVLEALQGQGADLEKGASVTLKDGVVTAEGSK